MKRLIVLFSVIVLVSIGLDLFFVEKTSQIKKPITTIAPTVMIVHLDPYKLFNLVNDFRASKGLNKLVFDPSMCPFAEQRLLQTHSDWSHNGFLPAAKDAYGYQIYIGENLAKGFDTEKETLIGWENSPSHLKEILDRNYSRTCIALDNDGNYVVQEFASY